LSIPKGTRAANVCCYVSVCASQTCPLVAMCYHTFGFVRYPLLPVRCDNNCMSVQHFLSADEAVITTGENILPTTHQQSYGLALLKFKNGPYGKVCCSFQLRSLSRETGAFYLLLGYHCSAGTIFNTSLKSTNPLDGLVEPGLE
jgi:hypothetical protein